MYQALRVSRSEFVPIRQLQYHVRVWGQPSPGQAPLVMVHGWMDVAASYQFVVDAFKTDHYVIAPDWRGYGQTESGGADNFWFPDYLADLDFLLDHYSPDQPVNLVGHSMGGNIVMLYTGTRPQRVRRLINLEGFGLPVLEAMAHGCPVVCSNTSSLPEVAGDAALYFDPQDAAAAAVQCARIITDDGCRASLQARGRERAAGFTWSRHWAGLCDLRWRE